jgi:serine/threonine-protein kinase RsbW
MADSHQIRLEIPGEAQYVGVVRQTIGSIATRLCFDQTEISDLKLAVGEALNNAVKHGCCSPTHPSITVVCTVEPDSFQIEISNGLNGCEPCPSIVKSVDKNKEGGMGLYIMKNLMDEVEIIWEDQSAKIRIKKNRTA